jgi:hypothetical protein
LNKSATGALVRSMPSTPLEEYLFCPSYQLIIIIFDRTLLYRFLMGVMFPHDQLSVIPYNRCVTTIGDRTTEEFLDMVCACVCICVLLYNGDVITADVHCNYVYSSHTFFFLEYIFTILIP